MNKPPPPTTRRFDIEPPATPRIPRQSNERVVRRSDIADRRSPPRTSVAVLHALPVFLKASSSSKILLLSYRSQLPLPCPKCPTAVLIREINSAQEGGSVAALCTSHHSNKLRKTGRSNKTQKLGGGEGGRSYPGHADSAVYVKGIRWSPVCRWRRYAPVHVLSTLFGNFNG